jgi:hypothetical protein
MTWHDGSIYCGAWEKGMQHGIGRLELPDGRIKEGLFQRNKFIGSPNKQTHQQEENDDSFYKPDFSQEDKIQRMRTDLSHPLSFDGTSHVDEIQGDGRSNSLDKLSRRSSIISATKGLRFQSDAKD